MSKIVPEKINLTYNPDNYKRNIWLIPQFFHHSIDDFLLGIMLYKASYRNGNEETQKDGIIYLPAKKFPKIQRDAAAWEGCISRTIDNHLQQLLSSSNVLSYDKKEEQYIFRNQYNKEKKENYYLLSSHMLYILLQEQQTHLIKIFSYLANNYQGRSINNLPPFNFTITKILKLMGYTQMNNPRARQEIKQVLATLCRIGAVHIHRECMPDNKYYIPYFVVDYMAEKEEDFQPMRAEDIEYLLGQLNGISKENIPFDETILDKRNQDEE